MITPGTDEYSSRKVTIMVDGCAILEMMVWADSEEQAAYQVCRVGRSIMRAQLERHLDMPRYKNGKQSASDDDAGVDRT